MALLHLAALCGVGRAFFLLRWVKCFIELPSEDWCSGPICGDHLPLCVGICCEVVDKEVLHGLVNTIGQASGAALTILMRRKQIILPPKIDEQTPRN